MSSGKLLLSIIAGVAAGAAIGILFAPDKGTKTRKTISKKADGYVEDLRGKFDDFLQSITDKYVATVESADDFIEKGKSKVRDSKKEAQHNLRDGVAH